MSKSSTTSTPTSTTALPSMPHRRSPTGGRAWPKAMLCHNIHALVALPVGLAGLIAALFGRPAPVGRTQRVLARRLLGVPVAEAAMSSRGQTRRVLRYSLVCLPADLLSFALLGSAWAVFIARGVLYPVFGADHLERSWGGPSLAGAWAAHFIQGPPLLFVVTLVLWPVSRYQARLARRHFGA
ncbi:hypothetical protein [Actinomadura sp. HBU206391]|uniref:hypothetical protein n=1 Tax=Actinomadura sp. HBU206391 TaxID=2731692 RepID=UPI00164F1C1A|nr:hypothetical protein [Actinomadura sp. HBU206391]MBC6456661.1 hypothetical protein [Actinomadura sp. HBU206391]